MWIPIISSLIAIAGFGLLAFGLRARRVDTEPHCRRCEYNLTGASSRTESAATGVALSGFSASACPSTLALCTECGTPISHRTVKWGEKRRRIVLPLVALLIMAAGAGGIYGGWNRNLWRQQCPFTVMLAMAEFGDVRAITELRRRYLKSELLPAQEQLLVAAALDKQKNLQATGELQQWLVLLAYLTQGGALTGEQADRYRAQAFHKAELVPRRRYRSGERLIVGLDVDFRRGDADAWPAGQEAQSGLVERIKRDAWNSGLPSHYGWVSSGFVTWAFPHKFVGSGEGDVLIAAELETDGYPWDGGPVRKKVEVVAPIKVVPADYQDTVSFVNEPAIKIQLESILFIDHHTTTNFVEPWKLEASVAAKEALPYSIAADVIAEDGETAQFVGTAYGWKGQRLVVSDIPPLPHEPFSGKDLTMILRFNPELTRKTVDLLEVYSGELRLGPVKIQPVR